MPWFDDLLDRCTNLPKHQVNTGPVVASRDGKIVHAAYSLLHDTMAATEWATEAGAALAAVLPESHPNRLTWDKVLASDRYIRNVMEQLIGVFKGVANQVRTGRLGSLVDAVRIESEGDLLEQADQLLAGNYLAAATVIAGGALETHLKNYCAKHSISITRDGSISTYNSAVGQARKSTPLLYDANDSKRVEAWAGIRNEAAHGPGGFKHSREEVGRMIDGIREFIRRLG